MSTDIAEIPVPVLVTPAWSALPGSRPKPLTDLAAGECRWPIGDSPFTFCSEHTVSNKPYCPTHQARAFKRVEAGT